MALRRRSRFGTGATMLLSGRRWYILGKQSATRRFCPFAFRLSRSNSERGFLKRWPRERDSAGRVRTGGASCRFWQTLWTIAGTDELPADAEVTVDYAALSPTG